MTNTDIVNLICHIVVVITIMKVLDGLLNT